jgi:hypothetical protein
MALPDVLSADEVLITAGGTAYRYAILNNVQPRLLTPFAGKVSFGETTQSDSILVSEWIMSDWSGGWGVEDLDESSQGSRFWYAKLDTRFHRQLQCAPGPESTTGSPVVAFPTGQMASVRYGSNVYLATHDTSNAVYVSTAGLNSWSSVHTGGGVPYVAVNVRLGTTQWLVIGTNTGYTKFDGTTWSDVPSGGGVPLAALLVVHDNKLWALNDGGRLFQCTNLSTNTWTDTGATLPVESTSSPPAWQLVVYQTPEGATAIHAVTETALFYYDEDAVIWKATAAEWPFTYSTAIIGKRATVWQGDLYTLANMDIFQYNTSTIRNIGMNRDDGLPAAFSGSGMREMVPIFNWLAVHNGTTIWLWNGTGWHYFATGIQGVVTMFTSSTVAGLFLYVLHGQGTISAYRLESGVFNPRHSSNSKYATGTEVLYTGWFDANWPGMQKVFTKVEWLAENLTPVDRLLGVTYQLDSGTDGGSTTALTGSISTNSGSQTFGTGGIGVTGQRIRFIVALANNTDTNTPILRHLKLKFVRRPPRTYGYTCTIAVDREYDNRTVYKQIADLKTIVATDTLVKVQFYKDGEELVSVPCLVTAFDGLTGPGDDQRGQWRIAFAEAA